MLFVSICDFVVVYVGVVLFYVGNSFVNYIYENVVINVCI